MVLTTDENRIIHRYAIRISHEVFYCGGILVTMKRVVTADHCLWSLKPANNAFDEDGERDKLDEEVSR